ncbi:MAG: helix-turn-helix domain-containing protein [Chryseobacterium sp.]|nr:MAG: helix-turn-helix domain-containing protein [Chryseobacterium sp.]
MKQWNNSAYQTITNAQFINGHIVVSFENGDVINVSKDALYPFGTENIEWTNITFNQFDVTIPTNRGVIEIPWDKLRVITDKDFAKYLAEKSEEQSKLIGLKIKRLREKKGIRSNDLAERAGMTPQTISRIEQGRTDVGFANLRKILAAMGYSLKDLANQELELESENSTKSFSLLTKRLKDAGINTAFLVGKIIPSNIVNALNTHKSDPPALLLDQAASYVSNIYGWTLNEIWGNHKLLVNSDPSAMAFFKKPSNANQHQIKAYSHYAYYMAKVSLKAFTVKDKKEYPDSIEQFKELYFNKYDSLDLASLLNLIWDMGICILPLNDSGVFHGASWNIEGRHVIVLKQNTNSHSRWIFDLLHELYHVFAHLEEENTSVIETDELSPILDNDSIEELEANSFANQVIFENRAEELAEQCIAVAGWDLKNLSKAVESVSESAGVRVDFLANYIAYRLSFQEQNWWSSANKKQITEPNPFELSSQIFKKRVKIDSLSPMDYNLISNAISNN